MSFVPLPLKQHEKAYSLYLRNFFFFPLIGAVLSGEQDGAVYADKPHDPAAIYVEHPFGFAQLFGEHIPAFEKDLERYLLHDRNFSIAKVRLYSPVVPDFLTADELRPLRSERQRFFPSGIATDMPLPVFAPDVALTEVDASNVGIIHSAFGVVDRFWRSPEDFVHKSLPVLAMVKGEPAALCYAAAIANKKAEIDVLTLPSFRGRGLGKLVVLHFIRRCQKRSLTPLWDCFTNNTPSMALGASTGFRVEQPPYVFFTIPKHP